MTHSPQQMTNGDHHSIADVHAAHVCADRLDDAHGLMTPDVAAVQERPEHPVQVQVRTRRSPWT